ncbi:MFS general substrate transporter [Gloeophyllum trabeum ATCC 11539]|uniref:MFS general substrate transporter n=1 Tax=Gloeophyllum trabeum (strain ATCC 11539 / FP-39264 / Madison 617) TaxID=670483 RepID=S7PS89_GLOTA|nr:MFS general substrate transporter [Gloeophyllum trabeum ATCC 11539]EPQ50676.1 MFS general substrate transporter [Gloeophyllum trabeum ATCC 11539]
MASEETPLLVSEAAQQKAHDALYDRFSRSQKRAIVAVVSWAGLLPFFVSGSFVPSIPQIARDFDSTGAVINLAVSLSILTTALANLLWARYSSFYGRRPIYLFSYPFLCIGSLGVASARDVTELMSWRIVQAFGASSGMSTGAAVIGDIYRLEERGTAMGVFFAACLLGPALAPLAGGLAAHYASWRVMQLALFLAGLSAWISVLLLLPETVQPDSQGLPRYLREKGKEVNSWVWVWLNPFKSLWLLRSPNVLAVTLAGTFVLMTDFVLLTPLAYTVGVRYNIKNEALIGAFFLPAGLGNVIGAPLGGNISDRVVARWRKKRKGEWVPEDRLRATYWGALVLVPVSILLSGLVTQFVDGTPGIVLNLICLFVNGIGIDIVLSPSNAYYVDVLHRQSAEVIAASGAFRSIILAASTACVLPLINRIGVAATDALAAAIAWLGFVLLWCTIRYGGKMRAWLDVGYSTIQDT